MERGLWNLHPKLRKTVVSKLSLAVGAMIEGQTPNTVELANSIRFQDEMNHGTSVPWPDHDESTKCWLGKQVTPSRALRAWWRFGGHKRFSCLPSWGQPP